MPARVICVASAKGGSGKTTLTATFGTILAELGFRVLLMDCDEATNGLTLLYLDEVSSYPDRNGVDRGKLNGIFDALPDRGETVQFLNLSDNLSLVPATFHFAPKETQTFDTFSTSLRKIKTYVLEDYDFILLDAQAGADPVSQAAMLKDISDFVIVVSEYDPLSAAGVERLKAICSDSLSFERTWILLNKMLPEFVSSFSDFMSVSHYLPPIPWTADVVRAYAKRRLALDLDRGNEFTLSVLQSLRSLPYANLEGRIADWSSEKASILREPVEQQYQDLEITLEAVSKEIVEIDKAQSARRRRTYFGILIGIMIPIEIAIGYFYFADRDQFISLIGSPWVSFGAMIFLFLLIASAYFLSRLIYRPTYNVELERLLRQRAVFSEQLRELETIRAADLGVLVKAKSAQLRS